jgi:uncharacterized membrane protein
MPSVSGWALRRLKVIDGYVVLGEKVSMPSVSGWALRRSARTSWPSCEGFYALGFGLGFATGAYELAVEGTF